MRFRAVLVLVVPLLIISTACAQPRGRAPTSTGSEATRYGANGTVLESPDHAPELCLGGVADSLPPQCTGLPLFGWDWSEAEGEESVRGTTWGEFHVVGTYDGDTLTVIDVGSVHRELSGGDPVDTPCPEPSGGWDSPDLTKASDPDLVALMRAVEEEPDFAGIWIDDVEEPSGEGIVGPGGIIANVAFTGDGESRAEMIRMLWGGPLCLVQHDRTYEELSRIQRELSDGAAAELGLEVLGSGVSQEDNVVEVGVVVAGPQAVSAVEERYGEGAVLLVPALEPVEA